MCAIGMNYDRSQSTGAALTSALMQIRGTKLQSWASLTERQRWSTFPRRTSSPAAFMRCLRDISASVSPPFTGFNWAAIPGEKMSKDYAQVPYGEPDRTKLRTRM